MEGAGNANIPKNIEHHNKINKWHFIYFGYTFTGKKAHAFVKFKDAETTA